MKNTLETRLGIFFALALVVAVIILEMVGAADYFKPGYQVSASFKNVQELKRGDPVKIAGVEVGRVEDIKLVNNLAQVLMKVNGKYDIKTDAQAMVKFAGLMGQNFVTIEGGTLDAPIIAHAQGGTLKTAEQPDMAQIMAKLESVADGVNGLTKSISPESFSKLLGPIMDIFTQNQSNITAIVANARTMTDDIAQGRGSVGMLIKDPGFYEAAYKTVTNLQAASTDLKSLMSQANGVIGQASGVMSGAQIIVNDINAGRGTIGGFVKSDVLYQQTTNTMGNLAEIMGKLNKGTGTVARVINDEALYKNAKLSLQKLDKATEGLEDQGPLSVLGILVNNLF
jgi:phospholipid/cholesterol/gamma-HCH transport system substrate-binding protein